MNVGMLWFDNDPRTALAAKVARAADYYRQKYGGSDLCLVHPSMLAEPNLDPVKRPALSKIERPFLSEVERPVLSEVERPVLSEVEGPAGNVAIRPNRAILPGHLWIGTEEKNS